MNPSSMMQYPGPQSMGGAQPDPWGLAIGGAPAAGPAIGSPPGSMMGGMPGGMPAEAGGLPPGMDLMMLLKILGMGGMDQGGMPGGMMPEGMPPDMMGGMPPPDMMGGMPGQGGEQGGIEELLALLAILQGQGGGQPGMAPPGMSGAQGPMPQGGNPLLQSLGQGY